ncbi:MAG TPA: XdhC family protein [Firmicutes bacterium]|nr:XdhC family protein [Bacillota bacterium]
MEELEIYQKIAELAQKGVPCAVATVVATEGAAPRHQGAKMLVLSDGSTLGTVGGGKLEATVVQEALRCLREGQSELKSFSLTQDESGIGTACGGKAMVFIEVVSQQRRLFVFGGGHVGQALARVAAACGIGVVVYDDREDILCKIKESDSIRTVCGLFDQIARRLGEASLPIGERDCAVVVTRDHAHDAQVLHQLLELPHKPWYIGMIGSREKVAECFSQLRAKGVAESDLKGVKTPIGLDIGAETPEEIAISILSEIIACSKLAKGRSPRFIPLSFIK